MSSINKQDNTFRQGTIGRFEAVLMRPDGTLAEQPTGSPTIEVIYIDTASQQTSTAVPVTPMWEISPGRYFFTWRIPLNHPLLVHQVTYWGWIDGDRVIGEDTFTVLPATPRCMYVPCLLTEIKGCRGCRK